MAAILPGPQRVNHIVRMGGEHVAGLAGWHIGFDSSSSASPHFWYIPIEAWRQQVINTL